MRYRLTENEYIYIYIYRHAGLGIGGLKNSNYYPTWFVTLIV